MNTIKDWVYAFEKRKKTSSKKNKVMTTDQLKHLFKKEAETYYASINRCFAIDNNNANYLNLLCKYFAQDETFQTMHKGDLNKGLYIYGSNGTGKSSSFKIIQNISRNKNLKNLWFPIIETATVVSKFNTEKNKDYIIQYYSKGSFLFDDLGAENEGNNNFVYGKHDIFKSIMESRYNAFINKNTLTHITTNLTLDDISKRYGSRVEDRFVEMFNFIELGGISRR